MGTNFRDLAFDRKNRFPLYGIPTFMIAMFVFGSRGVWERGSYAPYTIGTNDAQTLSARSICDYVIHFWMEKAPKCSLAAVCTGVHKEKGREVAFDSPRSQTCGDCRKKLSNDRNSRQKLIVGVVELSSLLVQLQLVKGLSTRQ